MCSKDYTLGRGSGSKQWCINFQQNTNLELHMDVWMLQMDESSIAKGANIIKSDGGPTTCCQMLHKEGLQSEFKTPRLKGNEDTTKRRCGAIDRNGTSRGNVTQ